MKQATISQPILAALAKVAVSTISRRFAQEDISPLHKSSKTIRGFSQMAEVRLACDLSNIGDYPPGYPF